MTANSRHIRKGFHELNIVSGIIVGVLLFSPISATADYVPDDCLTAPALIMPVMFLWGETLADAKIVNASDLSSVEFALSSDIEIGPEFAADYVFSTTREEGLYVYRVKAADQTFGAPEVVLEVTEWCELECLTPGCTMQVCDYRDPYSVPIEWIKAWDGSGNLTAIESRDGGIYTTPEDYCNVILTGKVYYSDGITPFGGARVSIDSVDDVPLKLGDTAGGWGGYSIYAMGVQYPFGGDEDGYYTLRAFAAAPECGPSTELVDVRVSRAYGSYSETDFVIPVPPPESPTGTPTPTAEPTPTISRCDLNGDGRVDSLDLMMFTVEWQKEFGIKPD